MSDNAKRTQVDSLGSWLIAAVAAVGLAACGGDGEVSFAAASGADAKAPAAKEAAPANKAGPTVAAYRPPKADVDGALATLPPVEAIPEIESLLVRLAATCETVKLDEGQMYGCDTAIENELDVWVRGNKPTGLFDTLTEIALTHQDPKVQLAASQQLADQMGLVGYTWLRDNPSPAASLRALKLMRDDRRSATSGRLSQAALALAYPADHGDLALTLLEAHPHDIARRSGYAELMRHGAMASFPHLEWASNRDEGKYLKTTLASPRTMVAKPSGADLAKICEWGSQHLGHEDPYTAEAAGELLLWCGQAYIPRLLGEGERRLAAGVIDKRYLMVLREICHSFAPVIDDKNPDAFRCEDNYALLEKVANTESVDPAIRGEALWNIYYQRRDGETLALLRKYESHGEEKVRARVKDAIDSLVRRGVEG